MRLRLSVLLSVFVFSLCLIGFSGVSIKASAALSGGRFMTTQECLDTFGSSFSVSYWDGTDIVQTTALYQSTATFGTVAAVAQTDYMQPGRSCLLYTFQGSVSSSPEQIQIDIQPEYSLFDIDQLHTAILTPANATYTTPYQSPQWIWMLGGQRTVFEGLSSANGEMFRTYVDNRLCIYCPVDWDSQSLTSGYSVRATFCSGSLVPVDGVYYIYIGVPYITYDAEGSNGTIGSSGTSVSGDINVNIDMSETNSLLSGIQSALSGIVSGIAGVFIPSDDDLQGWLDDMEGVYHDTFGQYAEIDELLEDVEDTLLDTSPSAIVEFPALSIPNTSLTFQARSVNLVRQEYSAILDIIKWAFDIAATCLFVNTMKKKLDEIILGKTVVELEGDD